MAQVDFAYPSADAEGLGALITLSIFGDSEHARGQLAEDAEAAGLAVRQSTALESLLTGEARPLGDIALVDCPEVSGDTIGALLRLDERAVRADCQLIVITHFPALDAVYACLSGCDAQILVDSPRWSRVIALGKAMAKNRGMRVREFSDDERVTLMRLTEQVEGIARRLDTFPQRGSDGVFRFASPGDAFDGADGTQEGKLRVSKPALPDPRLVREIIRRRQKRAQFFDGGLFADPAWDMLLDLTAARAEHTRVSVTSLCIASGVPPTTALRWIAQMVECGLFERVEDEADKRRAFIALSDKAADAMARYFTECSGDIG